jgi:hypothetical protein
VTAGFVRLGSRAGQWRMPMALPDTKIDSQ